MSILEWAVIGAFGLALFMFCARIMRRGLPTLDDHRKQNLERLEEGKRKLEEDKRNITASEQMYLAEAAARDLCRLEGKENTWQVATSGHQVELHLPDKIWSIELIMRGRSLRSRQRVLHGQSRWLLHGDDLCEEYSEISTLMASLARHLHGDLPAEPLPAHIARRIAANRKSRRN